MSTYTDPNTISDPTTGQPILAAWGDVIRTNDEYLARNKPRARVFNTTTFTHNSSGNFLAIPFGLEQIDVGGCHSTVSNTSRLVVPAGGSGSFLIGGGAIWASNATGVRQLRLMANGTTEIELTRAESATDTTPGFGVVSYYNLVAGDYVELQAFQNSGGNLGITSSRFWFTWDAL